MRWFTVPGWPSAVLGHAAAVPHLNRMAGSGAQQYKDGLTGQPGTQAIPVDTSWIPPSGRAGQAQMGLSRSTDAPQAFYPNLYFAAPQRDYWPGAGMPISVRSDNLMPVPAVDPRGIPVTAQIPINNGRTRGRRQIAAIPGLPTWPHVTGWNP